MDARACRWWMSLVTLDLGEPRRKY
jgi:hypothetical protein